MALEGKGGKEGRELPDLPHSERDRLQPPPLAALRFHRCDRPLSLRCAFTPRWCCGVQPVVELLNVISRKKEPVAKD